MKEMRKEPYGDAADKYFRFGNNLNPRDMIAVRKMISGFTKLIYPDGVYTKEEMEEIVRYSLEMRRRVKEQMKKIGGMEFYDVNFSYIDQENFEEHYVGVPEQSSGKLIPDGMTNPGQVYTVSRGKSGMFGVFALESQMLSGNGKFGKKGLGTEKQSADTALQTHYSVKNYLSLVDKLLDDVDYSVLERMIEQTRDADMPAVTMEDCNLVVNEMERIHHKYAPKQPEMIAGLEYIKERTGIYPHMKKDIEGFECFFCMAKNQIDEYIIVYQRETRLSQIIDDEQRWHDFQKSLYYAHIPDGKSGRMVYIIYILDGDYSNIPIQTIESNRTFGRKYVFTEEETVTFVNGIVKTSSDETAAVSPVQEWDRILREVHLTGCLTEAYSAKIVNAYLDGQRFDADYISDEEYSAAVAGNVNEYLSQVGTNI